MNKIAYALIGLGTVIALAHNTKNDIVAGTLMVVIGLALYVANEFGGHRRQR